MISSRYSFKLVSLRKIRENHVAKSKTVDKTAEEIDSKKRSFLKAAGVVGVGALAASLIPKKAQALVFGSTPTSSVVGVKKIDNTRIDPAQETGGNLSLIKTSTDNLSGIKTDTDYLPGISTNTGHIPAVGQKAMAASMPVTIASDQGPLAVSGSFSVDSVGIKDINNTRISPFSEDSVVYLRRIVKLMESQAVVDAGQRQRVTIDAITGSLTLGTVTAVTGITNALPAGTNILGSVLIDGQGRQQFTEIARTAYNTGIRINLAFS